MHIWSFLRAYTHSLGGPWFIISTAGLLWSLPRIWLGRNPRGVESLARNSRSPMWWLHPTVLNLGIQQRALLLCASYSSPLLFLHHTQGHLTKGFVMWFVLNWEGKILNWQSYCHKKEEEKSSRTGDWLRATAGLFDQGAQLYINQLLGSPCKMMGLPLPATPALCCQQYIHKSQIAHNMWGKKKAKPRAKGTGKRAFWEESLTAFIFVLFFLLPFILLSRKHAQNCFTPLPGWKVSQCFMPSQPMRL